MAKKSKLMIGVGTAGPRSSDVRKGGKKK